jgi:hypothetical protein
MITFSQYFLIEAAKKKKRRKRRGKRRISTRSAFKYYGGYGHGFDHDHAGHDHGSADVGGDAGGGGE